MVERIPTTYKEVFDFLVKIHEKGKIDDFYVFRTVYCGMHSRIPHCCIAFLVKVMLKADKLLPKTHNEIIKLYERKNPLELGYANIANGYLAWCFPLGQDCKNWPPYIPCPACLLKGEYVKELAKCRCVKDRHRIEVAHKHRVTKYLKDNPTNQETT